MLRFLGALLVLHSTEVPAQGLVPLFGFEDERLSLGWTATGKIEASRVPLAPEGLPETGPRGHAVRLESAGGGGLYTTGASLPASPLDATSVELWVHRTSEEAAAHPTSTIEVQFLEQDHRIRFFRKVEVTHTGWQRLELPLRYFRWQPPIIPRWSDVTRFGIWCRDPAKILVDSIALQGSKRPRPALLHPDDLAAIAFEGSEPAAIRRYERERHVVLTDAPELDLDAFGKHLEAVEAAVLEELPFLGPPSNRPAILIFAAESGYRRFPPRLAERFASQVRQPSGDGFTVLGVATSSWKGPKPRPVFTHEFVHSLLSMRADLDNGGEWLQEGLATRYQLRFHPEDLRPLIAPALADPKLRLPLSRLADGRPIPTNRYWQAATLVDLLFATEAYRDRLEALVAAFTASASTDLGPHLGSVLGTDWEKLESAWGVHCERKYAH